MEVLKSIVMLSALGLGSSAHADGKVDPTAVVRSFHEALSSGNRDAASALLSPDVVIFEQGGAEMSRDEYVAQHLGDDIEFTRATKTKVLDQHAESSGATAWVITSSETSGSFRGKDVSSRNTETMVLRKTPAGWRIAHIHWSSHRREPPKP